MAITKNLNFTKTQLAKFGALFKAARLTAGKSQMAVARAAFGYEVSHCKVSRIERAAMLKVDAHCLERVAVALMVPKSKLLSIDKKFADRAVVAREATRRGFWAAGATNASIHM